MANEFLDEREFELINIIGKEIGSNQRDLSRHMNLSLGMVNMLIRRLIAKGLIRINQLDKRKVEYLLTPRGFTEKMRKSVKYTLNTLNSIGLIKDRLKSIIEEQYAAGHRQFFIYSEADLTILIERAFNELNLTDIRFLVVSDLESVPQEGLLFVGKEKVNLKSHNGLLVVDLIAEIAKETKLENINHK